MFLFFAFPVPKVKSLGSGPEPIENFRLTTIDEHDFEARRKPLVIVCIKHLIVVTQKGGILVEFYVITSSVVVVFHEQFIEFFITEVTGSGSLKVALRASLKACQYSEWSGRSSSLKLSLGSHHRRAVPL